MSKRNWFNAKQQDINKHVSDTSVQLVQRKDTLVKLLNLTKFHINMNNKL